MMAREIFAHEPQLEVEVLDLSRLTSEYGRVIHPCKTCVSTAMPLCHWPCSCYPNHALGQVQDWMNDIYAMWAAAHGVMIVCPVNWYGPPSGLKLMIDRHGLRRRRQSRSDLDAWQERRSRRRRWSSPAGPIRSISPAACSRWSCTATTAATEAVHRAISGWLRDTGLIEAGHLSQLAALVGYHAALRDQPRRPRPRRRISGRSAQRRPLAGRGGEAHARVANCSSRTRACTPRARSEVAALQRCAGALPEFAPRPPRPATAAVPPPARRPAGRAARPRVRARP